MNRIADIFDSLKREGRGALMPFITAGDPDLERSMALLAAMESSGASICELGIAFSDPIADGPVIQQSMSRALAGGVRVDQVFEAVSTLRPSMSMGLVGMVSYSIVHRRGLERFVTDAARAGFDGLIFPDLPVEEAERIRPVLDQAGVALINLIAPGTSIERARRIAAASTGFVYVVAHAGITGERTDLPAELSDRVAALRQATDLPIAVGFGISDAEHVRGVVEVADGAIVGSAVVRRVAEHAEDDADRFVNRVAEFVRELAQGVNRSEKASAMNE